MIIRTSIVIKDSDKLSDHIISGVRVDVTDHNGHNDGYANVWFWSRGGGAGELFLHIKDVMPIIENLMRLDEAVIYQSTRPDKHSLQKDFE